MRTLGPSCSTHSFMYPKYYFTEGSHVPTTRPWIVIEILPRQRGRIEDRAFHARMVVLADKWSICNLKEGPTIPHNNQRQAKWRCNLKTRIWGTNQEFSQDQSDPNGKGHYEWTPASFFLSSWATSMLEKTWIRSTCFYSWVLILGRW